MLFEEEANVQMGFTFRFRGNLHRNASIIREQFETPLDLNGPNLIFWAGNSQNIKKKQVLWPYRWKLNWIKYPWLTLSLTSIFRSLAPFPSLKITENMWCRVTARMAAKAKCSYVHFSEPDLIRAHSFNCDYYHLRIYRGIEERCVHSVSIVRLSETESATA